MLKQRHNSPPQADQSKTEKHIFKQIIKLGVFLTLSVFAFLSYTYFTQAQIPDFVNYQGRLRDNAGNPITTPTTIQFSLYSHITNGAPTDVPGAAGPLLWTETYDGSGGCAQITPGTDGIFAQHLGDCVPFPAYLDFTQEYYLGVKIGGDNEATPRVPLSTHPYAFTSKRLHVEGGDLYITNTDVAGNILMNTAGGMEITGTNALFPGAVYNADYSANYTNRSLVDKEYVDEQLMWEIMPASTGGMRIQPKNNSVRQIFVQRDDNSYTQFKVRNNNDVGNGAGAIIELKGSGADYTNNMYIGKYGAGFWIPELQDNGAVLTDKNLVIGTASAAHEIHFVTGNSYSDLRPVVVADNEGFRYTSDLSATFVDRTLVDKAYVDNAIIAGTNNIYTADGTLTGERGLSGNAGAFGIAFTELSEFNIEDTGSINFEATGDGNFTAPFFNIGSYSTVTLDITSGVSAIFNDHRATQRGVEYGGDYEANFIPRSLVTKQYVDGAIASGQPTFQDVVDRSIAVDGYAHADLGAGEIEDDGGMLAVKAHAGFDFDYGVDSFLRFSFNGGMGNAGHAYIYDERSVGNRRGLEYHADYSADYTNRSLVDKEYVDNAILTGANTLYLADGTLAADRTVTGNNHSLTMTGLSSLYQEVSSGGDTSYIEVGSDELLFGTTVAAGSGSAFGTQGDNAYMQVDNGAGSLSSIVLRTTDMTVTDQINLKGLVYADDYSANYTNRSLVDKEYVDTQVTNGVTASNGLNKVGPDIKLGGSLSQYTVIDKNDNGVLFTGLGTFGVRYGTGTTYPHLDIGFHSFELGYHTASDDVSLGVSMGGKMTMTDTRHLTGIEYAADYSANYTNRTLVDKEYVDNAILSGTNNIYTNDGTLTGDRYVDTNEHELNIDNSLGLQWYIDDTEIAMDDTDGANLSSHAGFSRSGFQSQTSDGVGQALFSITSGGDAVFGGSRTTEIRTPATYASTATVGQVLTLQTVTGSAEWADAPSATNIYNTNGTLSGDRTLSGNNHSLNFSGMSDFNITTPYTWINTGSGAELEVDGASITWLSQAGQLVMNTTDAKWIDLRAAGSKVGIEYDTDYSANYTNRSLVDKAYVDSHVGTSIFDADADTGIQVERTADDDNVYFQSAGHDIMRMFGNSDGTGKILTYGDYLGEGNETKLEINDVGSSIQFNGLNASFGDTEGNGNDSQFSIVDADQLFYVDNASMQVTQNGAGTGELRLSEDDPGANGGNYVGFIAPASLAGNQIWTLPGSDGTNGQVLQTNGAGVLSWRNLDQGIFDTDNDTGMWVEKSADEDMIRFDIGDSSGSAHPDVMVIDADGEIGIGTSDPSEMLTLYSANAEMEFESSGHNSGTHTIYFKHGNDNSVGRTFIRSAASGASSNGNLSFGTNNTSGFEITASGQVRSNYEHYLRGNARLGSSVNSGVKYLKFSPDEAKAAIFSVPAGSYGRADLRFTVGDNSITAEKTQNEYSMIIARNGNVGIGDAITPNALLDVRGDAIFNDDGADADFRIEGDTDQNLFFVDAGNNRVGIGIATPSVKFQVSGQARASSFRSANGTAGSPSYRFDGDTNTGLFRAAADNLAFTTGGSEAMRIDASNNLGIGITIPTAQLHTTGTVRFANFGAGTMQTDANGNVSVSSDERLKNIQGVFNRGLAELLQINPIEYKWKKETGYDTENSYYGFSAQNVKLSIPEAVGEDNRGYLTLSDRPILATAINAIKEQQGQIEEFKSDDKVIDDLREALKNIDVDELENRIDDNENLINEINDSIKNIIDEIKQLWEKVTKNSDDIEDLKKENDELKKELCKENDDYSWCDDKKDGEDEGSNEEGQESQQPVADETDEDASGVEVDDSSEVAGETVTEELTETDDEQVVESQE